MSCIDLEDASDWVEVTNTLPSLEVLILQYCNLNINFHPIYHVNFLSLSILDLSGNHLGNNIPLWVSKLRSLTSLSLCEITVGNGGPIPEHIQNLTSLVYLDLSVNSFNTSIPSWLYSLSHLEVLNLRENQLTGTISNEIKNMTSIITLDLSENELQGDLPTSSMAQLCKLKEIDMSGNTWNRSISQILDSFSGCLSDRLKVLKIQDGQIYGHLTNKIGQFKSLTDLDLSSNSISGLIPESLWQLVNLEWLNIGNNHMEGGEFLDPWSYDTGDFYIDYEEAALLLMKGELIEYNKTLALVNIIDLSGTQLQSFDPSSFTGNNLCGPPLTLNCSTNGEVTVVEKNRKEDEHEMSWFYIGMAVGFIVGFWGVCGSLIFNRTWRHTYFAFLDCVKDQIYVASLLKLRWFRETITSCYNSQ
ncbi:hypothetical protein FEM48_Zijuj09G0211000 [Ziziphus jujuba var. spinosa]|uniref:Disease resistance R13L4/SHOC-2-like LRR domain-containing protein n=1 Tax=Ziziphus jujuba var. spinosa TaxID=714518 RepID=A0A978UVB5_ZIZJJ|nr:hypothetical protein FEM48_Zijuj09G0211000 [Ziziphus jujuba var. spinosa]